jgi:hypothetical protein
MFVMWCITKNKKKLFMAMQCNNFGVINFGTVCLLVQEQMLVASNGHQSW